MATETGSIKNGDGARRLILEAAKFLLAGAIAWGTCITTIRAHSEAIKDLKSAKVEKEVFDVYCKGQYEMQQQILSQLKDVNQKVDQLLRKDH